jgi:hypothetical protein
MKLNMKQLCLGSRTMHTHTLFIGNSTQTIHTAAAEQTDNTNVSSRHHPQICRRLLCSTDDISYSHRQLQSALVTSVKCIINYNLITVHLLMIQK